MPDTRKHRGQHPSDKKLFRKKVVPHLRTAVADYSWLLSRGYPPKAALKLVGDRFQFNKRQQSAIQRNACSDQSYRYRQQHRLAIENLQGKPVLIDAYNLLITIESALSDGLVFIGRDGCYRDLASIHGSYRRVEETFPALQLIGDHLEGTGVPSATWYIDSPVSNSGRLKGFIYETAQKNNWNWHAELVTNPDKLLIKTNKPVVTTDSGILDEVTRWVNLTPAIVEKHIPSARIIDLRPSSRPPL